jgi:hypothetical protein
LGTDGKTVVGSAGRCAPRAGRGEAKVLVGDRDPESAQQTVAMIEAEDGTAAVQPLDVTDDAQCAAAIAACSERFGRLDVLVNNVGIGRGDGGVTRITDEAWDLRRFPPRSGRPRPRPAARLEWGGGDRSAPRNAGSQPCYG